MTAEPTYNKHLVGLTAFFILGDAIISLPVAESGGASLLGFLVAALAAVAIYFSAVTGNNYTPHGKDIPIQQQNGGIIWTHWH